LVKNIQDTDNVERFINDIIQDEVILEKRTYSYGYVEVITHENIYMFMKLNECSKGRRVEQVIIEYGSIIDEKQFNAIVMTYLFSSCVPNEFKIQRYGE